MSKRIKDLVAGNVIRFEWAPRNIVTQRPAKIVEVKITEASYDNMDGGQEWWIVTGTATPQWGEGQYAPFKFHQMIPANREVEVI